MGRWRKIFVGAAAGALMAVGVGAARGVVVTLQDGSTYEGTIENRNEEGFDLRISVGGMSTVKHFSVMEVADIDPTPRKAVVVEEAGPTTRKGAATRAAASQPSGPAPGFFEEMWATAWGQGPDDLERLPEALQQEWGAVVRSEALGNRVETLGMLGKLEDDFAGGVVHGEERLDGITRRERKESFGEWMARIHWDAMYSRMAGATMEVGEVRAVEKEALIGILKEQTVKALEPLEEYFPKVNPKTGKMEAFKPAMLSGITKQNGKKVLEEATWATAVLAVQLKVEPAMGSMDKAAILGQMRDVGRVRSRAAEVAGK